ASSTLRVGSIALRSSETSLPRASPNPPGSTKSRCMSMMTSAQLPRSNENSYGSAPTLRIATPRANGTPDRFRGDAGFELFLGHRPAEEVSLHLVAAQQPQQPRLV